jgi:hypothetical protein
MSPTLPISLFLDSAILIVLASVRLTLLVTMPMVDMDPMMYTLDVSAKVLADMSLTMGVAAEAGIPPLIIIFAETAH